MVAFVRATHSFFTQVGGKKVRVRPGDDPRRDDDPVVKKHPGSFRPVTGTVEEATATAGAVEEATAEPGRARSLGRPKGKGKAAEKHDDDDG